nr:zinc finger bed domain-containing protein ricesleeper 1 [Quercus suber]
MAACASSSIPSTEPTPSSCAEANQPNTQAPIPPSGAAPPQTQTETQQATINGGKEPSKIWDHFSRIEGCDPLYPKSHCNYCKKCYNCHPKRNGTSAMWSHIKSGCKKYPYRRDKGQTTLTYQSKKKGEGEGGNELVLRKFSVERLRMALARMIIVDELPFRFVEHSGFIDFMSEVEPRFEVPSRVTVARDCLRLYIREKESLRKVLMAGQRVCLTTDTWTSIQNLNYLCLTAHYIDVDWVYHKKILNFYLVPDHKGETIGRVVESCLLQWGIDHIFTITVDNASSNDVAIEYLRRKTKDRVGSLLGCEFLHMRCCAHILNLIVQDGLKELNESIVRVRNVVRYVKSSPNRFEKFKACVEKEKIQSKSLLCLDVSTRWNSTYLMLDSALKFVAAFERMEEDDGHFLRYFEDPSSGPPRFLDWENVRLFTKFLGMFYEATLRFSGSLFVTTNVYFHELVSLQDQLNQLCNGRGDPLLKGMAQRMKLKYDKYWGSVDRINLMLFVAVVVDPRYKLKYVRFWFKQWYDKEKADELGLRVREVLNRLYNHYSGAMGTPCGASASGTSEFGSSDVAAKSSMLSSFGSAEERMKS